MMFWTVIVPAVLLAAGLGLVMRSLRERPSPACRACGYDLRASSDSGACPECGMTLNAGTLRFAGELEILWRRLLVGMALIALSMIFMAVAIPDAARAVARLLDGG
jgi:hypothetical protein